MRILGTCTAPKNLYRGNRSQGFCQSAVWTSISTSNSRPIHFDIFINLYFGAGGSRRDCGTRLLLIIDYNSHFRPTIDPATTHATVVSPIRYPKIILRYVGRCGVRFSPIELRLNSHLFSRCQVYSRVGPSKFADFSIDGSCNSRHLAVNVYFNQPGQQQGRLQALWRLPLLYCWFLQALLQHALSLL
jgi:hypothetical protein